ncbi:hypothetical protein [Bradyrhizobium sp. 76]|jgi:hypothetical protein|uniref:hypothetical protein n=1 Tax=Bradyrhizobium sp. 76 TaxID=2782680 RepID=UPI001FF8BF7B|nr:hypothetical protein [Bradyrhizobium sp. 76]MCK1408027.1 hypothetical protein [Bradyrhizobium sp. 76]
MPADQAPPADASDAVTELDAVELNDSKRQRIGEIRAAEAAFPDLIAFRPFQHQGQRSRHVSN